MLFLGCLSAMKKIGVVLGDLVSKGSGSPNSTNRAWMRKLTPGSTISVDTITYLANTGSNTGVTFKGVIYDSNGASGFPGTLLAASAVGVNAATSATASASIPSTALTAGHAYWVGVIFFDNSGTSTVDSGGGNGVDVVSCLLNANNYASPLTTADTIAASYTADISIQTSGYS